MVKNLPANQGTWFDPWVGKSSWRRKWQPTLVFLPGKPHGQRSLAGYDPWRWQRVRRDWATKPPPPLLGVRRLAATSHWGGSLAGLLAWLSESPLFHLSMELSLRLGKCMTRSLRSKMQVPRARPPCPRLRPSSLCSSPALGTRRPAGVEDGEMKLNE